MPKPSEPFTYIPKSRRWKDNATGNFISKKDMQLKKVWAKSNDSEFGFAIPNFSRHPDSDVFARVERLIGKAEQGTDIARDPDFQQASKRFNEIAAAVEPDVMEGAVATKGNSLEAAEYPLPPQPIPTGIRAAMNLSEMYCNTQGDVWQYIEATIDNVVTDLVITSPGNPGYEKELRDLYAPDQLDMKEVLSQIMLLTLMFGSAYPLEIPGIDRRVAQIVQLPPKYMWVGYHLSYTDTLPADMPSPYAIRPWNGAANWTQELANRMFMPMTYNSFSTGFNEQVVQGWGIPVSPEYLHPVRGKALAYNRYPLPAISRAFGSLSTRQIYKEMRRATLEGYKNQLWLFLLGNEKMPPSPNEMAALNNAIAGLSGNRTGNLAWRWGLDVKVIAPQTINDALGNEASQAFTLEVFRDLGSNVRLATGNRPMIPGGGGGGDSGLDIDLSVWLRRIGYIRDNVLKWEYMFRLREARKQGEAAIKAARESEVKFEKSLLESTQNIKQEILPLYTVGLMSPQTGLKKSGNNYDTELENKKQFKGDQDLFGPPATYAQLTVNPNTPEKRVESRPTGRPADDVNPKKVAAYLTAAWEDEDLRSDYFKAVLAALSDELWEKRDPERFIATLKRLNTTNLKKVTLAAYEATGGIGTPDLESLNLASNFVNSFTGGFLSDLNKLIASGEPLATDRIRWRTMLYPQEGYRMAVVNGQRQAMSERGASHWQRVLHPELSQSGPCDYCIADSTIIHAIEEPFTALHPNEVCSTLDLHLSYFTGDNATIQVPVPAFGNDLENIAQNNLGGTVTGRTRRRRA